MANIDWIIRQAVEDIWLQYDNDNSGYLDKEEAREFVRHTMVEMFDNTNALDDSEFETAFVEFDADGSGTIEKDEMALFIRKIAGLMPE